MNIGKFVEVDIRDLWKHEQYEDTIRIRPAPRVCRQLAVSESPPLGGDGRHTAACR